MFTPHAKSIGPALWPASRADRNLRRIPLRSPAKAAELAYLPTMARAAMDSARPLMFPPPSSGLLTRHRAYFRDVAAAPLGTSAVALSDLRWCSRHAAVAIQVHASAALAIAGGSCCWRYAASRTCC
jgi:hypothetical protein